MTTRRGPHQPPEPLTTTLCHIEPNPGRRCGEPAHVVLFSALGGQFAGRTYRPGERVLACLHHGGQIYDARHHLAGQRDSIGRVAAWLTPYLDRLPLVKLAYHVAPTNTPRPGPPWGRPTRPRREKGPTT